MMMMVMININNVITWKSYMISVQVPLMQKIITNPLVLTANEANGPKRRHPSFDLVVPIGER